MTAERQPLSKLLRVAISILLIAHLLAVLLPPLSFQARGPLGTSPSVATALAPLEGYAEFLYIDRGYAFFAPDPGPSYLIQAAITDGTGQQMEILYPDLEHQWPRLLYHRHFMLTEFLQGIYEPSATRAALEAVDPEEADRWVRARSRYEHVRQSVVEHLKHEYPGRDVQIQRIEHLIPGVIEYQREPVALNDPRFYRVILDVPVDVEATGDLTAPAGPPESIPPPTGASENDLSDSADPSDQGAPESETPSEGPFEEADSSEKTKMNAAKETPTETEPDENDAADVSEDASTAEDKSVPEKQRESSGSESGSPAPSDDVETELADNDGDSS